MEGRMYCWAMNEGYIKSVSELVKKPHCCCEASMPYPAAKVLALFIGTFNTEAGCDKEIGHGQTLRSMLITYYQEIFKAPIVIWTTGNVPFDTVIQCWHRPTFCI